MINLTEGDREKGSRYIVMSLKAQINALKIMMNRDYLIFMNITLYNEVIKKFISPQCSQYVLVALTRGRMVHTHKLLWEFLISKRMVDQQRHQRIETKRIVRNGWTKKNAKTGRSASR